MAADKLPTTAPGPRWIPDDPAMAQLLSRPAHELYALARSPYWRKLVGLRLLLARAEARAMARPEAERDQATLARLRENLAWLEGEAARLEGHTHGPAVGALFCRQCGLARCDWPRSDKE